MSLPPLTTLLRRSGWRDPNWVPPSGGYPDALSVIREAFGPLRKGPKMRTLSVDSGSVSLFGAIPNSLLRHYLVKDRKYIKKLGPKGPRFAPSGNGWSYAESLSVSWQTFLLRKNYWFHKLKPVHQAALTQYCYSGNWRKLHTLILHTDGMVCSVLLSIGDSVTYRDIDTVTRCVISNTLNKPRYQADLKSYKKEVRKAMNSGLPIPAPARELSWFYSLCKRAANDSLPQWRVCTLCQTRACGLADKEQIMHSALKWVEVVTTPEPEDLVMPDLGNLTDTLSNVSNDVLARARMKMRTSISTSACLESPRGPFSGGKMGFASRILQTGVPLRKRNLYTGELSDELVYPDTPGEYLFHLALGQLDSEEYSTVRMTVVNEGGYKARCVTSDSFFHSLVLQPWSHFWLEVLSSIPETSGVTEARHGWGFVRSLSATDPELGWLFENLAKAWITSSDLSEATDRIWFYVARRLVRALRSAAEFPAWYASVVERSLCDPRRFHCPELGISGITTRGIFMGDAGSKVILTLCGLVAGLKIRERQKCTFRIVGDDFISVSLGEVLPVYREEIEKFGLKVSEPDAYSSRKWGFFTEELFQLPSSSFTTVEAITAAGSLQDRHFPYLDIPKVRLLLNVAQEREVFSSSLVGRIQQWGANCSYLRRSILRSVFQVGSWLQDCLLDLRFKPEFVYVPSTLCSTGKEPLFGSRRHVWSFWNGHKNGKLRLRYASLIELADQRGDIFRTFRANFFRHTQGAWFSRVADRSLGPVFEQHRILETSSSRVYRPWIVPRLREYIISETEIKARLNLYELLFAPERHFEDPPVTLESIPISVSVLHETAFERFLDQWLSSRNIEFNLHMTERYYKREEVERMLELKHPFHVDIAVNRQFDVIYEPYRSLERDRETALLYRWVLDGRGNPPTDLISDDLVIARDPIVTDGRNFLLVSDDKKLGRYLASIRWRRTVYQLPCWKWILAGCTCDMFSHDRVLVDLGSLDAAESDFPAEHVEALFTGEVREILETDYYPVASGFSRPADIPYEVLLAADTQHIRPVRDD